MLDRASFVLEVASVTPIAPPLQAIFTLKLYNITDMGTPRLNKNMDEIFLGNFLIVLPAVIIPI